MFRMWTTSEDDAGIELLLFLLFLHANLCNEELAIFNWKLQPWHRLPSVGMTGFRFDDKKK